MELTKWDKLFMDIALRVAEESKSTRLKVGSVLVKDNRIISSGFNGLVSGYEPDILFDETTGRDSVDVVHSEINAILYCARYGISTEGCTLYVTHIPCRVCSSSIATAKIVEVKYLNDYRDKTGVEKLKQYGVKVTKLNYEVSVD